MEIEDLKKLNEKLNKLSEEEWKQRKRYLRKLANGELQGPPVGKSSIDQSWLKAYDEEDLDYSVPKMTIYEYMMKERKANSTDDSIAMEYLGMKIKNKKMYAKILETAKALKNYGVQYVYLTFQKLHILSMLLI